MENGRWRNIRGRKVFIKNDEALANEWEESRIADDMKASGKFPDLKREDVAKAQMELRALYSKIRKTGAMNEVNNGNPNVVRLLEKARYNDNERRKLEKALKEYDNPKDYKKGINSVEGKHINKEQLLENSNRYKGLSNEDGRWVTIHGRKVYIKDKNTEKRQDIANKIFGKGGI